MRSSISETEGQRFQREQDVRLRWPLASVQVSSSFGRRGGKAHEGIDLRASSGTPVFAAEDGIVLYSGRQISGYGNLIVIRHSPRVATVYAHNQRNLVVRGQRVKSGHRVALAGRTGRASGPHLHFEVRVGQEPVDPIRWLPRPGSRVAAVLKSKKAALARSTNLKRAPPPRSPAARVVAAN